MDPGTGAAGAAAAVVVAEGVEDGAGVAGIGAAVVVAAAGVEEGGVGVGVVTGAVWVGTKRKPVVVAAQGRSGGGLGWEEGVKRCVKQPMPCVHPVHDAGECSSNIQSGRNMESVEDSAQVMWRALNALYRLLSAVTRSVVMSVHTTECGYTLCSNYRVWFMFLRFKANEYTFIPGFRWCIFVKLI